MNLLKYSNDFPVLLNFIRNNPYPVYPAFSTFLSRLKTYDSYPSIPGPGKYLLSEGGFKYTGSEDKVQCFYCGLVLRKWEKGDNVWLEHSKWNPKCIFVLLYKGKEFIAHAQNEFFENKKNACHCTAESYDVVG